MSTVSEIRGFRGRSLFLARCYLAVEWAGKQDAAFSATVLGRALGIPRRENACRLARAIEAAGFVRRIPRSVTSKKLYVVSAEGLSWLGEFRRRKGVPVVSNDLSKPSDALGRARHRVRFVK